uniref:DUF4283 domain-containing protein n=1 Tax=Nicotiana tabacum TaxID=4097 RepID=A0A1S3XJ49_TOBAC|nr:PREDICTED: uncharacterized protein LOC107765715 [Nicotiana tabacum]
MRLGGPHKRNLRTLVRTTFALVIKQRYVAQNWSQVTAPDLFLHEEGYNISKLHTFDDLKDILYGGSYTINSIPMILKQWTLEFDLTTEFLTEIRLWITLPNLPMSCWGNKALSKIASAIGKPLFADECTSNQMRISYARILVEANVTKKLPTELTLQDPYGRMFQQQAIYEWKPHYCAECMNIGHDCELTKRENKEEHPRGRKRQEKVTTRW